MMKAAASAVGLALVAGVVHGAEVDTRFLFGFSMGADVGEAGEREIELETTGRLGKRDGSYAALSNFLRVESTPVENLHFELGVPLTHHRIAGVAGLDDRGQWAFDGLAFEVGYRLLDREHAGVGLALAAEPHWSRVDETSGAPVDNYGSEITIAVDRELVANLLYGALNVLYDPEATRLRAAGVWQRDATLGVSAALATQVGPGAFVGAEARYLRRYDGLGFDAFAGEALFVGPTMFARLSERVALSGALTAQVAGRAAGDPASLDLTNFERYQARLRLEMNF